MIYLKYIILLILLFSSCTNQYKIKQEQSLHVECSAEENIKYDTFTIYNPIASDIPINEYNEPIVLQRMQIVSPLMSSRRDTNITGTLTYRIDSLFIIGSTSRVEARITKRLYEGEPTEMIELFSQSSSGDIMIKRIATGEVMDVELKTLDVDAFTINKISSGNQRVDENNITEWIWGVTPKKVGSFNLILKVIIKLQNGVNVDQTVFDKIINVQNKPKRSFNIYIEKPEYFKYKKKDKIKLVLSRTIDDTFDFQWGGNGRIEINFNDFDFNIIKGDNTINDDKNLFIYEWEITPNKNKEQIINFDIKITGDNDILKIYEGQIHIEKDWQKKTDEFIDTTLKRWYFVFASLLIPLFMWIRKKYFTKGTEKTKEKINNDTE